MFTIAYSKRSKKIVYAYKNDSVGVVIATPEQQLESFCENNNLDVNDFTAMEYPWHKNLQIEFGNHLYNPVTGLIEEDPSYVPPVETQPTE